MLPELPLPLPPNDAVAEPEVSLGCHLPTPDQSTPLAISGPITVGDAQLSQEQHHTVHVTQINSFGLFRIYNQDSTPINNPEDQSGVDLCSTPESGLETVFCQPTDSGSGNPYHPYPNKNSWRISDWYWNHGIQKSKKEFEDLIKIIGSVDF